MSTFGKFEVVTELHSGERGSVFSARAAGGGREIKYAVKTFSPRSLDADEQFWESQSFTERARVQQRVAEAGGSHWAPVYEIGTSPAGTYYVTNFHPLSAASLVTGRVDVSAGVLYSIVRSVVAGLNELKATAGRAHGNLRATNVLVDSRGDVAVAGAVLTDPAPAADAANTGEAGDIYALGGLIHLLVLGRPFQGGGDWPLGPAREWARLGGRQGRQWRRLCNDLLAPDPAMRPQGLDAVGKRIRRLVPRRAQPSRRLSMAVALVVIIVAAGAAAALGFRDAGARRQVCAAKRQWAGGMTAAMADPKRRALLQSDPDLARVVHELDLADLASFDCDRAGGRFGFNPDLRKFRQTQDTLDAVRRAERGLSPIQWRQLARAAELQGRFEARGWSGPARHLAQCIAGARPGSADLAGGIERFLVALKAIDDNLDSVEKEWVALQTQTRALEETRDPVMRAFAAFLRSSAASSVRLTDAGFGDLRGVRDASGRAAELVAAQKQLGPQYDEQRFNDDIVLGIAKKVRENQLQSVDIDHYLGGMAAYRVQEDKIREAVTELRNQAKQNETLVLNSGIEKKQANEFQSKLNIVSYYIKDFAERKFIERDFVSGDFAREREAVRAQVALIKGFVRMDNVKEWLDKLAAEPLGVPSQALNAYWNDWRENLPGTAAQFADKRDRIGELQDETRRLHDVLLEIDRQVPAVTKPLTDDDVLATAAGVKREEVLTSLLADGLAVKLARQTDPVSKVKDAAPVKAAHDAYRQWQQDLAAFSRDFPIRQRIATPDLRPDEKWAASKPAFWNDRIIQSLVAPDLARLGRLRELASKSRDELVGVARDETREELALQAWRLLGTKAEPAWPTRAGELKTEAGLRARLAEMLAALGQTDEATRAAAELADEGPRRWTRFAESAGTDEAMLASALALRGSFGVTPERFASLTPETRFNLSLLDARHHMGDGGDAGLAAVVAELTKAAKELKDRTVADTLAARLARVGEKEPFAGAALGDEFTLQPTGTDAKLVFRRVKREGRRPFFLATTEVSFGQFAGVVDAASAWDELRTLVWSPEPGNIGDPRRGPRSWEWVMRPAPRMYPPQWWLFPEEANDFPKELRDPAAGRFNRTVLSEAAGGVPSDRHPVQYVTPEAAMYFASLVGCRLPTPDEWQAAFDAGEKAVPAAQWNLRDETWRVQKEHVATLGDAGPAGRGPQWPDDGIYLPPRPAGEPPVATGAAARSLAQRDGTLYFRPTDAAGGSTFRQLVGNVAEIVCDAPEPFEQLKERTPQRVKAFTEDAGTGLFVIGGSALSPPELPADRPQPLKPGAAYADVGFRLAFTAPSRNLAEKLEWALAGQGFVKRAGDDKTASAAKAPQGS